MILDPEPGDEVALSGDWARYSPCRKYRYLLVRKGIGDGGICVFLMLNPSTADAFKNDPTVRRCVGFAQKWGFGTLIVTNIFAYRSTDPAGMLAVKDPVGALNDDAILWATSHAKMVVAAWGTHGSLLGRGNAVTRLLRNQGTKIHHLGLTKGGFPKHPLYVAGDTKPESGDWF